MIQAIITDFDGTLVDTFEANFKAYQQAFKDVGRELTREQYKCFFGQRFDDFMRSINVCEESIRHKIRDLKKEYYPSCFGLIKPNTSLLLFIEKFHSFGGKTAIASTASEDNLNNAISYLGFRDSFDVVMSGNNVLKGKPDPEIYLKTIEALGVDNKDTLVFEDSEIGLEAANRSGVHCILIGKEWFE